MPKQTAGFTRTLPPRDAGVPLARWLYLSLRAEILEGRLRPGARVPSTRELARQYGLSRGTIVSAFEQLTAEGYVEGRVGSGTHVSNVLPDELLHVRRRGGAIAASEPNRTPARRVSDYARRMTRLPGYPQEPARAFRTHQPALDLFPTTLWAQLAGRRLRRATRNLLLGCAPTGYRPLQEAVADYLTSSRGVKCGAEQVAIVSGVQEALDLVARVFLNPGDRVVMENPGYAGAARVFDAFGARITPVSIDDEGAELPASRVSDARLAYLTPAHQFPLGVSMSLRRRLAWLEWARTASEGALIFEDDYDSEFRYAGNPLPALQGLDRHGVVLFAGSFSKVLFPSLRLGYLAVSQDLVDRVAAAQSLTSRHAPLLQQAVLCDFITEGHFGRHVRRMRQVYAERLDVLLQSARQHLTDLVEIVGVEAGLQTAAWLGAGLVGDDVELAAAERSVEVASLSRYTRGPQTRQGLQLGFAAVDSAEIRRGVRELAVALEHLRRRSPERRMGRHE